MNTEPSKALAHIRVLDVSRVRAGPTCCRILGDFGADIIKIEAPPGVDPNEGISGARDGYDMINLHRNKRSLTLNLKERSGHEIFMRLVKDADVVVENFRPDVKDRMGIGYEALSAVNPRIILASISGFGQDGPYRMRAGFDQIAQGMGGLMWVTGMPKSGPMRAGIAVADSSAGVYAATGILIALAEREQSGRGQWVQTSLLQAQIAMMDFQAARYLVDGVAPGQAGNDHPYSTPMGVFPTADGFINIGVGGDGQWRALCVALGRPELGTVADYATNDMRLRNRPRLSALLSDIFRTKPSAQWLDLLEHQGVPAGPIYKVDEVFADPQVQHLGIAEPLHHPTRGDVHVVGTPITMSRTPAKVVSPLPDPGAHTDEILRGLGYSAPDIANLRNRKIVQARMADNVTLVTGASGFLGRAVMKLLAEQKQRAIGLDPRASDTVQVVDDLSDRTKLTTLLAGEKITHIIHAGGVSGPMVLADDPAKVVTINVLGSLNLLYAAMDTKVRTFVYCSSAAALGSFHENEPVDENYPLRPNNTYSASKAAMEMVLRGLWGNIPLDLCSLRFTVIYGPGRETTYTVEEIVGAALAGKTAHLAPVGDWPYIYIDDAARAAAQACYAKGRRQLSYFIAYPERVTPDDIAAAAAAAGRPVRIEIDASRPRAERGPLDVEPAARDFGFRAQVGHREGVRRLIESAR